jgi:hypothetical protein
MNTDLILDMQKPPPSAGQDGTADERSVAQPQRGEDVLAVRSRNPAEGFVLDIGGDCDRVNVGLLTD